MSVGQPSGFNQEVSGQSQSGITEKYAANLRFDRNKVSVIAYGISGKPKLLTYDLKVLVRWGGIATAFTKGTIFTVDDGIVKLTTMMTLSFLLIFFLVYFLMDHEDLKNLDTEGLENLAVYMNGFVPFVLGLYVEIALVRWWALRVQALGTVFDSVSNVAMLVSCVLPGPEHKEVRLTVVKWGMASIYLLVKAARDQSKLEDLAKKELLSQQELDAIKDASLYGRAMIMWGWIMRICQEHFGSCRGPPPHAPKLAAVFNLCLASRNGIQTIHTYLETQLPFAYVHLITLLVNVNNLIICIKCAVVFSKGLVNNDPQTMGYQLLMFLLVPVLYQGLLSISYVIHDPFGEDMLDFPIAAFAEYVAKSCDAMLLAQENYPMETLPAKVEKPAQEPVPEPATNAGPVVESMREIGTLLTSELGKITAQVNKLQYVVQEAEQRRVQDADRLCSMLKARQAALDASPAPLPAESRGGSFSACTTVENGKPRKV